MGESKIYMELFTSYRCQNVYHHAVFHISLFLIVSETGANTVYSYTSLIFQTVWVQPSMDSHDYFQPVASNGSVYNVSLK